MSSLIHLIYASRAQGSMAPLEVERIVQTSRRNNEESDVTGMLLFSEGHFFQVLEGPAVDVERVFRTIADDPRHCDIVTIIRENLAERHFPDWSMGFVQADEREVAEVAGISGPVSFDHIEPGRARKLLDAFRRGRWQSTPGRA